MDRRSWLALAGGTTTLACLGLAPAWARAQRAEVPRYVVTDRRLPGSVVFGEAWVERGSLRLEVTDGLTRLWREALWPLWQSPDGTVTGLTSRDVWACLTEQARGQGRQSRLVDAEVHAPSPALVSWIIT